MHTKNRFAPILLLVSTMVVLAGCASTYRDPRSVGLSTAQMAILEESHDWDSTVYISEVNGRSRGTGIFTRYELPPGRNTVLVTGNSHAGMYPNPTELAFVAEAGRVYQLKYETSRRASLLKPGTWNDGPGKWRAWIVEKVSGKAVDEESLKK